MGRASRTLRSLTMFCLVSALAGTLLAGIALPVAGSAGWTATSAVAYFSALPGELVSIALPQRSVLLAADGSPITWFYEEDRVEVPLDAIAPALRQAVIAVEDSRFYQHGGIDPRGMARAAVNDTAGGSVQGASTLTQQYVKNVLVEDATARGDRVAARAAVARTTTRKLREMRLAVTLENRVGKDQILQRYLNIVYFGGHTYGAEAAAERYFGVPAGKLTLAQSALLAGMIQEPSSYDPVRHPAAAQRRRNIVLARMLAQGMITQKQRDAAAAEPVRAPGHAPSRGCTAAGVDGYFCDYVVRTIGLDPQFAALGRTAADRQRALDRGGLVIRTTLDPDTQYAADQAVRRGIPPTDSSRLAAAAVTVEPGTGKVLAMAQNRTYSPRAGAGLTSVNYTADGEAGGATGFQTGSAFKPFTLAAWLTAGGSLDDTVDATKRPFPFRDFRACGRRLRSRDVYTPGNAEGRETGKMSVLAATYDSVNVAYVDLESRLDLCGITDLAGRLGVHLAVPGSDCGGAPTSRLPWCVPSLTLGAKEIAPLTMAGAYAGFASGGTACRPLAVTAVQRAVPAVPGQQEPVPVPGPSCRRVLRPDVAHGVTTALTQVLTKGTAAGVGPLSRWPSAGKTGTTDGPYDTWFVGYTPQRSTAVWVADPGHAGRNGTLERRRLGDLVVNGDYYGTIYGATLAAPIWKDLMENAMARLPVTGWS